MLSLEPPIHKIPAVEQRVPIDVAVGHLPNAAVGEGAKKEAFQTRIR